MPERLVIKAILFDLWDTLVPSPVDRRNRCFVAMAADLDVDPERFADAFRASYGERFTGATGSLADTVLTMAERCGGCPGAGAVERAVRRRMSLTRSLLTPTPATLRVLDELRMRGFALALVSDSSIETPTLWDQTPLATRIGVTAFSCLLGVRKPDPAIYLHATEGLGVAAADCLYVGDGDSAELTGAEALGMRAVRLRPPGDDATSRYADDATFSGLEIGALDDLLLLPALRRSGWWPSR